MMIESPDNTVHIDQKRFLNYFEKTKPTLSKVLNNYYGIKTKPQNFYPIDQSQEIVYTPKKEHDFFFTDIKPSLVNFYTSIYHSKTHPNINFPVKNEIFKKILPNILEFFDTFYAETQIFYMGNFETNRKLDGFLSSVFTPEINVFQSAFKVVGFKPRFKHLSADIEKKINTLNLIERHEDYFFNNILNLYKTHLIPKDEFDYEINFNDDSEKFKEYMDFLKMLMF